jgi:hypothetical protein
LLVEAGDKMYNFSCEECESAVFLLPDNLEDESPVVCGQCDAYLCTWAERKAEIEQRIHLYTDARLDRRLSYSLN